MIKSEDIVSEERMIEWQHRKPALPAEEDPLLPPGKLLPGRPEKRGQHLQVQAAEKPPEGQAGTGTEAGVPPAKTQPGGRIRLRR